MFPLPSHEALAQFFTESILGSLFERFGAKEARGLVRVSSEMSFTGFSGYFCGKSVKISDAYAMLPGADFPTVVCEAGWSERFEALLDDARLWLLHTSGQTRAVILVSFMESYAGSSPELGNNKPKVEKDIPEMGEGTTVMGVENDELGGGGEKDAEEPVALSEEQMVVESIDDTTGYHALAARLLDLNCQGKLKEPLVGTLGATVHVYKACQDGKEIMESFMATLLLPLEGDLEPPEGNLEKEERSGFGVELVDLLGDNVPMGHDPKNKGMFSLKELEKFVGTSLPETEKIRLYAQAVKLLRAAGQWEERETWAQKVLHLPHNAPGQTVLQDCQRGCHSPTVAAMYCTSLPVPEVFAYDCTTENELGFEWIIMEKVTGGCLRVFWHHVSLERKAVVVEHSGQLSKEIRGKCRFGAVGSLYQHAELSEGDLKVARKPLMKRDRGPYRSDSDYLLASTKVDLEDRKLLLKLVSDKGAAGVQKAHSNDADSASDQDDLAADVPEIEDTI
ncbi:hypothetical protein HOY82DRAFT_645060 [Tuber indicum]|nr:hypothetical protein HOY82DRAFT_645060 [Tuber indicum]